MVYSDFKIKGLSPVQYRTQSLKTP
ncbi:IS3 family transposase [Acinetobacter guillouiae]|nr:IS3 family transposase [Acinetobacter guillouiae]